MKSDLLTSGWRLVLAAAFALSLTGGARAAETASATDTHYVIKVTPTLAYVDIGRASGAAVGDEYLVLRPDEEEDGEMIVAGQVRILRVFPGFSIAEITSVKPGEEIAVLHVVMPIGQETAADQVPIAAPAQDRPVHAAGATLGRSLVLMGGMDLSKEIDLTWGPTNLRGARGVSGPAVAVRLARGVSDKLRLALTYRLSGESLGPAAADVTQLSIELDAHILFRGLGKVGPYLGVGGGLHQLTWDVPNDGIDDSAFKAGFNLLGGFEIPIAEGRWSLFAEGGYQRVTKWASMLDASHVRLYTGLGFNF